MTMVADPAAGQQVLSVTGGVDTHAEVHVAAAIDAVGRELGHASFPTTPAGYAALLAWLEDFGPLELVGVEGTGVYGAGLTRVLQAAGVRVVEVDRPDRKARRYQGKSDPIDACAAARAALSGRAAGTPKTRTGSVEMIRTLRVARAGAVKAKAVAWNQLKARIKTAPEELRERLRDLDGAALLNACTGLRAARGPAPEHGPHAKRHRPGVLVDPTAACKRSLAVLARRIRALEVEIADLDDDLQPSSSRPPQRCSACTASASTSPGSCWPLPGTTPTGCAPKRRSRTCAAPRPSPLRQERRTSTGSTAAVTATPTTRCGASP